MRDHHRPTNRVFAILSAAALLLTIVAATTSVGAAGPIPVKCDTAGVLDVDDDGAGATTWALHLEGVCDGNFQGSTIATVDGQGTSTGAGLCDGSLLVRDLEIDVLVTERNVVTGQVTSTDQTWSIPVATYPIDTTFTIGGGASGIGTVFSRIFAQCGDSGSANARAYFEFRS